MAIFMRRCRKTMAEPASGCSVGTWASSLCSLHLLELLERCHAGSWQQGGGRRERGGPRAQPTRGAATSRTGPTSGSTWRRLTRSAPGGTDRTPENRALQTRRTNLHGSGLAQCQQAPQNMPSGAARRAPQLCCRLAAARPGPAVSRFLWRMQPFLQVGSRAGGLRKACRTALFPSCGMPVCRPRLKPSS